MQAAAYDSCTFAKAAYDSRTTVQAAANDIFATVEAVQYSTECVWYHIGKVYAPYCINLFAGTVCDQFI